MTSHTSRLLLAAGASLLALNVALPSAYAQSMDYGALEQLYGEPVTTSATGKPQKISEVPANMEIITQDQIRRSGADNIPDVLRFVTGVDVRRTSFGEASVGIRGYGQAINARLLVLVNGRQVYLDDYGYVPWQTIPVALENIRQIELVKGPASALFGFNAVAGVVNIITYDPLYDNNNVAALRTGTQNLAGGSATGTVHVGQDVGMQASAGGYLADEFSGAPPYVRSINPKQGFLSANTKAVVAPGLVVSLNASAANADNLGVSSIGAVTQRYYRTTSIGSSVSADTSLGALGFNFYRNGLEYDSTSGVGATPTASPTTVFWNNQVYVVQASDLVRLSDDHTVRFGLEYRNNSLTGPIMINQTIGYGVISGSTMWDWQITPTLSLTNAFRLDHLMLNRSGSAITTSGFRNTAFNNRTIDEPSFNTGLVYRPTDLDTVRLTVGRGVQVPSLLQFGFTSGANPNLDPTTVTNYEIDYDRSIPAIGSVLRTALFYQTNSDLLATANASPSVIGPLGRAIRLSNNIGSSNEFGLEIGIKGHSDSGFRWNASYTFANVTESVISNKGAVPDTPFDYMHGTPVHSLIGGFGYSVDKWEFDAQGKWQSSYRDYIVGRSGSGLVAKNIDNYFTATARAGYSLTEKMTVALTASQFNAVRLTETAALPTERRLIASVTVKF